MHYKDAGGNPASSVVDYTDGNGNPNVDKAGNQLSMGNLAGQWTYTYDHAGRIASIVPPNPVPEQGLGGDYGYNWLGQLTNPPADPNHLTYNSAGLLATWPGMYSYTYKANGAPHQIKNPSGSLTLASFTYDSAELPSELQVSGVSAELLWDADDTLLGYSETAGGSESQSVLTDPTASVSPALMADVSGTVVYYVCDPEGCAVASVSGGSRADCHSDGYGRIQLATGDSGAVEHTYVYGPDDELISTDDPLGQSVVPGIALLSIGKPPWYVEFVPFVGPAWSAIDDFQNGNYLGGIVNTAFAVSDVVGLGAAGKAIKIAKKISGPAVTSWAWKNASRRLHKAGFAGLREPIHHYIIRQGGDTAERLAEKFGKERVERWARPPTGPGERE